jgi:hypothetical protein
MTIHDDTTSTIQSDHRGRDHMVFGFTITYIINAYNHQSCGSNRTHGEVYSIQHYVIKFVSDLRQVGRFLRLLLFPLPTKLTAAILLKYC